MKIIRCDKCNKEIPEYKKKEYKFLYWSFETNFYETDFWHMSQNFSTYLCKDCMKKFQEWLNK